MLVGEVPVVVDSVDGDLESLDDDTGNGGHELPHGSRAALHEGEARDDGGGGGGLVTHFGFVGRVCGLKI